MPWRIPRASPVSRMPTAAGSRVGNGHGSCAAFGAVRTGYRVRRLVATSRTNTFRVPVRHEYGRTPRPDDRTRGNRYNPGIRTEVRSCGDVWIRQGLAP